MLAFWHLSPQSRGWVELSFHMAVDSDPRDRHEDAAAPATAPAALPAASDGRGVTDGAGQPVESAADGPARRAGSGASSVLARIDSLLPSLRLSERKIAAYVLAYPAEVVYLSVTDLADRSETSEATVIRFAQRLGFGGYAALKIALALELRASAAALPSELRPGSSLASIKQRVMQIGVDSLGDTAQLLDDAALGQALDALLAARRIELYGVGGSAAVAQDAYFALMQVGLPAVAIVDPHLQLMSAVQLRSGDVAFAISQSGDTRDTVEALQLARDAGATCLCITRHARSRITQVAHVTLLAAARLLTIGGYTLLGRLAALAVIDTLAAAAALRRQGETLEVLRRGRQAISETRKF
jgi:DNA-binding MurR/RpiR family transcriptional regulator